MNEKLKKRIIGGVVLVSLGAIAIPMMSPNDNEETLVKESIIPPKPQTAMQTSNIDLKAWSNTDNSMQNETVFTSGSESLLSQAIGMSAEENTTTVDVPAEATLPSVVDADLPKKPAPIIKPAVVPPKETKQRVIRTESPAKVSPPSAVVKAQPQTILAKIGSSSAWAVQVGSFKQRENAERLRQKLKELGYRAFVSSSRSGGKTVVRVRVGPQMEKTRAKQVKRKIEKQMKIQAMLVELK